MSYTMTFGKNESSDYNKNSKPALNNETISNIPGYKSLENNFDKAITLIDDIVLKKYLYNLSELNVVPLSDEFKDISDIRIFKVTEMVYQNKEYSTYKFASVFNAVQNLNCGIFVIAESDGKKTDFYMGVRSFDNKRTTKSLKDTLKNALIGQFPGVKTKDLFDPEAEKFISDISSKNIASVSCVAKNKDEEFKNNDTFIQGLEKMVLAMQGQSYTAIFLAKSTSTGQLEEKRHTYENIYTQLSPFANMQVSYGTNTALNISDALSYGTSSGKSYSENYSKQTGTSDSTGSSRNNSLSETDILENIKKTITFGLMSPKTKNSGNSVSKNHTESKSTTKGTTYGTSENRSENFTSTKGYTSVTSDNMQLTMQNKTVIDILEKIKIQLKRLDECESVGMWECAAYFLSDSQETAEMASGTYKALIKGESSGIETSSINFWGNQNVQQLPKLHEYITNFIHPIFEYSYADSVLHVTPSSLVSSNELAIQMGLPRKSVCGFPVIKHADFGKEIVRYSHDKNNKDFVLGKIFSMGIETGTDVKLDCNSLAMHTFITGSTGSGKSNTVYEILNQLKSFYDIPFLVIEPAKGEYKNIFGQFSDVSVYGTNPQKTELLRINPFSFPNGIHVLEHLDRLVEIFNVCWPMYAAMPAILKEAMEKAYMAAGWSLSESSNPKGNKYPNFMDLLEQIETVIDSSKYSADSKGDYSGALITRVRSLTNGLNRLIFCSNDLNNTDLFDKNVIIDLSRVGSSETKSLIMGILVMKLNEYRMESRKINSPLSHITVLEEAHNLLKKTSTEQMSESSNLLGKSVELLSNSIAEMRTYGEGFIIADQSPGLLDMSVIRNTNTKIILRLPEKSDRELVGYSAGLNDEQIDELAKLKCGTAAVYQNDWIEPVLVQVNRCDIKESSFNFNPCRKITDSKNVRSQIINLLIQGRVNEKLDFNINEIERNMEILGLSSLNLEFIEEQITEFKENKKLELWEDKNFRKLSKRVTDILDLRNFVENCVVKAADYSDLNDMLETILSQNLYVTSKETMDSVIHCLMKDMSLQSDESETRRAIYKSWADIEKKVIL